MLTTLKNRDGYIYSLIDWRVVDNHGEVNKAGHYLYIRHFWIHPKHRNYETWKMIIGQLNSEPEIKDTVYVYWKNTKHNYRLTPLYLRTRLVEVIRKESSPCLTH